MTSLPTYVSPDGETVRLTGTSSMPCASWSLPAVRSCPGSKLSQVEHGDNAVCGSCYARKGFYRMNNVKGAQDNRMVWTLKSIRTGEFVAAMRELIQQDVDARGEPIFRVHDSGDLFSVAYVRAWFAICESLPDVQFWFPTRSHTVATLANAIRELAALPNVTVRPSGLVFDEPPPIVDGLAAGTTVIRSLPVLDVLPGVQLCPKTDPNDGRSNCDDCRACWEGSAPIAYFVH